MGSRTQEFEKTFAELLGCRHAIAVSSGTAALHLAMLSLDIGSEPGHEVIQPSINFVAGANMTIAAGAKPVFADILSLDEPTIDPDQVKALIGPQTKAIMVMHYGGYPARLYDLRDLCRQHNLALIEDACHACGYRSAAHDGAALGTIGDIGCFSFFANKNMTTGEGGMVVTNSDELAARLRSLRSHGMTTLSWERHKGRAATYDVTGHGFNYRIDDLRAALGIAQLEKLPGMNERRQQLAGAYAEAVKRLGREDIQYVYGSSPSAGSAHLAAIIVDPEQRDRIRKWLAEKAIQSSLHYPPVHEFSAFKQSFGGDLPITKAFSAAMITLPLYPGMAEGEVNEIIDTVAAFDGRSLS